MERALTFASPTNNTRQMNTLSPTSILAPVRNRIWVEDSGTETMLCKFCGEWQNCFEGAACPTCVECAKAEGEQLN